MPAGLHDGAIIVDTGLNNAGFNRDARQYKAAANSLKNAVNRIFQSMGKSGEKYTQALANQVKAERELNKQIDRTREKYAAVVREMNELQKTGGSKSRYDELSEQAKGLAAKLGELRQAKQNLGGVSASFDRVADSASNARKNIVGIMAGGAWSFLKKLAAGAKNAAVQLAKIASRAVTSGMKKLAAYALGAARGLFGLGKGARDSGRGFQFSLKNLLKYGLGIRSLFVLFNRLRSAIKEGFGALKEYDPRVRASLASLSAAMNSLKGASAAAFAPILNAITPALTTLINLVTQATNALGMFFAALTGQSTYSVAKGVASIGSSAKSSSGSVKELKRQLAGFDELNILSAGSSGGSGSGGGGASSGISYEQTPIAAGIKNFVEQIKALVAEENWDGLGGMIAEKINGALDKARALISWRNIGGKITEVMQGITGTINGFVNGIDWPNVGATLAEGLNTIVNTALLWYRGIDWAKLGRSLAEALNGLIRRIDWAHIGDLISEKLKALFDFTKNFVITFDEIAAAKAIRTALGRIDWPTLARDFWDTAKTAFKKAGNFIKVLMGGDVYDVAGDAVDQMWERGSGSASSQTYATSWVRVFIDKLGATLKAIPWGDIFNTVKEKAGEAISELVSALFGTENGQFVVRFGLGIAAAKLAITGLLGDLSKSIVGGLTVLGVAAAIAAAAAVKKLLAAYDELEQARKDSIQNAVDNFEKAYKNNPVAAVMGYEQAGYAGLVGKSYDEMVDRVRKMQTLFTSGYSTKEAEEWINLNEKMIQTAKNVDAYLNTKRIAKIFAGAKYPEPEPEKGEIWRETNSRFNFEMNGGDYEGWRKLFEDNTDALEKNTKSNVKQTKATSAPTKIGGILKNQRDYDNRWMFAGSVDDVNIPVNFLPANMSQYINRPLEWLNKVFAPGTDTDARVQLLKQGWTSIAAFVGTTSPLSALLGLVRNGWSSLTTFVGTNNPISALLGLVRNGWTTLKSYTESNSGGTTMQGVNLNNGWGGTVNDWVGRFIKAMVLQGVNLNNGWGGSVNDWVGRFITDKVAQAVNLRNGWGYNSVNDWVGYKYITGAVKQTVDLVLGKVTGETGAFKIIASRVASGGVITAAGHLLNFAAGGAITAGGRGSWWNSAKKYATGTAGAHGTMFVAGEAGPEIVGHVNGRTEILNQSQLAQTMRAATYGGMVQALQGLTFTVPAMATGGVMPYEVSAQIARSTAEIQGTLDANHEDLVQTIISVAGQLAAAIQRIESRSAAGQTAGALTAQQVIDEINRRTQMFSASPLKGV